MIATAQETSPRVLSPLQVSRELRRIQERHELLKNKLDMFPDEVQQDSADRQNLLVELHEFFDEIRPVATSLQTTGQYEQLSRIADQWQTIFSSVLQQPINIRDAINLSLPSSALRPSLRKLPMAVVQQNLEVLANDVAKSRKVSQLFAQIESLNRLTRNPDLLHERLPSTPNEALDDWRQACLFLSADILEGRLRMAEQLLPNAFEFLMNSWLEEAKTVMAYFRWQTASESSSVTGGDQTHHRCFYFEVCESLHDRLLDATRKSAPDVFAEIEEWLGKEFLMDGRLNTAPGSRANRLIAEKAYRVYQRTGREDSIQNWSVAEAYVRAFYENIIPCVTKGDMTCLRTVLDVLCHDSPRGESCELVNVFEAALAIEFLEADAVRACYRPERSYL